MTALELVYQYRQLLAKCEGREGLSLEEIEIFSTLEQLIDGPTPIRTTGQLRAGRFSDPVQVAALGRVGAICSGCPHLERGQRVELRFEDDELSLSYRFAAEVSWTRENSDDTLDAGLRFTGAPVLVRHRPSEPRAAAPRERRHSNAA